MGAACSKVMNTGPSSSLDYGSLNPQGIYTTDTDYDGQIVRALIRKGQLAPFYHGKIVKIVVTRKLKKERYLGSSDICMDNDISYETECPICFLVI